MFTELSSSDVERSTSDTRAAVPIELIGTDRQPLLPTDDDSAENVSDDPLADQPPANEEFAINGPHLEVFADFNECLLDDLLTV